MKKKPSSPRLELPDELQSLVEKREEPDRRAKGEEPPAARGESRQERRKKPRRAEDGETRGQ